MLKKLKTWWNAVWTAAKGWRTMIASAVLAVVGVLQTADWATIVSPRHVGPAILGVAVAVALLRVVTDTPVGRGTAATGGGNAL